MPSFIKIVANYLNSFSPEVSNLDSGIRETCLWNLESCASSQNSAKEIGTRYPAND